MLKPTRSSVLSVHLFLADTLRKVRDAVELGELDAVIEQQARFGRRVTAKNK